VLISLPMPMLSSTSHDSRMIWPADSPAPRSVSLACCRKCARQLGRMMAPFRRLSRFSSAKAGPFQVQSRCTEAKHNSMQHSSMHESVHRLFAQQSHVSNDRPLVSCLLWSTNSPVDPIFSKLCTGSTTSPIKSSAHAKSSGLSTR
jgi:hypothetical protein